MFVARPTSPYCFKEIPIVLHSLHRQKLIAVNCIGIHIDEKDRLQVNRLDDMHVKFFFCVCVWYIWRKRLQQGETGTQQEIVGNLMHQKFSVPIRAGLKTDLSKYLFLVLLLLHSTFPMRHYV